MSELFNTHFKRLMDALEACSQRGYWSPFQESPSSKHHPPGEHARGKAQFESYLGSEFKLNQPGTTGFVGSEISPYTGMPLGIRYPDCEIDTLMKCSVAAMSKWKKTSVETRTGICMEILARIEKNGFLNTYATMHTSGMPFTMAFAGAGANALDRGLEALAYGYKALKDIPTTAKFSRQFGVKNSVYLEKTYRVLPRGTAVIICCGTFPTWNAYPAMMANLVTANPIVIKPHPNSILPMALAVEICRNTLVEYGFDPNIVCLAADEPSALKTIQLVEHPNCAIVDFTGSPEFGAWLESKAPHTQVYTETAGCNALIIESTDNFDGMIHAIAQSLCLFSAQMCTSPQNIYIPKNGIQTEHGKISTSDVIEALIACVDTLVSDSNRAAALCGAVMSSKTIAHLKSMGVRAKVLGQLLRQTTPYTHPHFPEAQTATPLILSAFEDNHHQEHFGPLSFVIQSKDRFEAIEMASALAKNKGSIAAYVYSTDTDYLEYTQDRYAEAGASIGCNLIKQLPINFTAAYSDYHVTGLNPAGNACLTDLAFVCNRFRIVQFKTERHSL